MEVRDLIHLLQTRAKPEDLVTFSVWQNSNGIHNTHRNKEQCEIETWDADFDMVDRVHDHCLIYITLPEDMNLVSLEDIIKEKYEAEIIEDLKRAGIEEGLK